MVNKSTKIRQLLGSRKPFHSTPARRQPKEGLRVARLLMVLSNISPLFVLWAIRGNSLVPEHYFIGFCVMMIVMPNVFLWLRIWAAKKQEDKRELTIGTADVHRDYILLYMLAMLLPFYSEDIGNWRYLCASFTALCFMVFLLWHLNLNYMNMLFALLGYRVFTVYPPANGNPLTSNCRWAIITRRVSLNKGDQLVVYRLSNTVYLETLKEPDL